MATFYAGVTKFLAVLILDTFLLLVNAKGISFTIDLVPINSPLSPFYNPNTTWHDHYNDVVRQSYKHANGLRNITSPCDYPYSDIVFRVGHLMRIFLGTNLQPMLVVPDTGSDFLWIQCEPCDPNECTNLRYPRFMPQMSSTYQTLRCNDPKCTAIPFAACDVQRDTCIYAITYAGGQKSRGDVVYETISFPSSDHMSTFDFSDIVIGCSFANEIGISDLQGGVAGMGPGVTSLFWQIKEYIDRTFSYCLPPWHASDDEVGKILFGTNNIIGPDVITTKLYITDEDFFLNLIAITIGSSRYVFPRDGSERGNIIIDSGSSMTNLPHDYYRLIANDMNNLMQAMGAQRIDIPNDDDIFCYYKLEGIEAPTVIVEFEDASIALNFENLFMPYYGVDCFAFRPTTNEPIYGSVAQINFWVEYAPERMSLSFKPTDCFHIEVQ